MSAPQRAESRHRPIEVEMTLTQIAEIMQPSLVAERDEARERIQALADAAEIAVTALLPVLPLSGSWGSGYAVNERVDSTIRALPEEWAEAAHAIAELHAALERPGHA